MTIATKTRKTQPALKNVKGHTNRGTSHAAKSMSIQPTLTIGKPNDKYEQEADRVADKVISMAEPSTVQKKCSSCAQEEQVQQKPLVESITPWVQKQVEEEKEPMAKPLQKQEEEEDRQSDEEELGRIEHG